jgi:hypothetical protein
MRGKQTYIPLGRTLAFDAQKRNTRDGTTQGKE